MPRKALPVKNFFQENPSNRKGAEINPPALDFGFMPPVTFGSFIWEDTNEDPQTG